MKSREERDLKYLEALEDITQVFRACKEKYGLDDEENLPQALRLKALEARLDSERRILEELSSPCRFIVEHLSTFMDTYDQTIGFRMGLLEVGRGRLNDIIVGKWSNVTIVINNVYMGWRDQDYQYLFYPDKVILRSYDPSKPEIQFEFTFAFKYSKVLEEFGDVPQHPQTLYCHPGIFDTQDE